MPSNSGALRREIIWAAVPVYINTFFENRVRELFDLAHFIDKVFSEAEIDYRVAGGLATFLYVEEAAPDAGRTTRDVDIVGFRLKDQTHIKDLQEAGLITPEIERTIPTALQDRLQQVLRTA